MENDATKPAPAVSELQLAVEQAEAEGFGVGRHASLGEDPRPEPGQYARFEPRFEPLGEMTCRLICEMSDGQLEEFIGRYQELVSEAEQNLESRKAKLGAGQLEKAERAVARKSKVRSGNRVPKMDLLEAVEKLAGGNAHTEPAKPVSSIEAWVKRQRDGKTQSKDPLTEK